MRIGRAAATALFLVTLGATARASPRPGDPFPKVTAQDLTGQQRSTDELKGQRALVVAITDREAGNAVRAWYTAADAKAPSTMRESLVSLRLPFFISTPLAQSKAREQVPRQHWQATLLDRGDMAKHLGLEGGQHAPYVFVLDENGRVVAAVHGTVDSPGADAIWNALAGH
jgi:hypothetical protein